LRRVGDYVAQVLNPGRSPPTVLKQPGFRRGASGSQSSALSVSLIQQGGGLDNTIDSAESLDQFDAAIEAR
jgi:hypothetical protein